MNEIERKYMSVLRSFVEGSAPEPVTGEELPRLLELARIHSTLGICCHGYLRHPECVPRELLPRLRRICLQEIALYSRRGEQMKTLAARLDEEKIECIYFKGFVVRDYYPVPELRTFGDVDFVIRREDRQKADALMKALGYEPGDTWEPAYSYRKGAEYYEIHTDVMEIDVSDKADYVSYYSHIWEHTRPARVVELPLAREFTPEFHFLYLLTHIAKHISGSGAGIRMYLDIAFYVRHFGDSPDWDWIAGELEKLQLKDFANMVLSAVECWFGVESPLALRPVAPEILEDFLEFTLAGGTYGYNGRDKSLVFLKQENRNQEEISRVRTLMHHAFPSVKSMENRYTYLQKRPWLLPAAWVHRLAASRSEWGRFASHTKNILTADEEEARKLKRLYKEIGL